MSLDVYLTTSHGMKKREIKSITYVGDDGPETIDRYEFANYFSEDQLKHMEIETESVIDHYSANITHNLTSMASEAGIYKALWRPEEINISSAGQLIPILEEGLKKLGDNREHFETFNPSNGWGDYDGLVRFTRKYLKACKENPDAKVLVWR